jgi:hypothetical protein
LRATNEKLGMALKEKLKHLNDTTEETAPATNTTAIVKKLDLK